LPVILAAVSMAGAYVKQIAVWKIKINFKDLLAGPGWESIVSDF